MGRHTATFPGGRTIDVDALNRLALGRPVEWVKVESVYWVDRHPRDPVTGFDPARYVRADTRVPILVLPSGELVDGRHRICKLADLGGRVVPVRRVTAADLDRCTLATGHAPPAC